MKYTLSHPEWATITISGVSHYGFDQEWYPERWQRLAGCGPTTGAVMLASLLAKESREIVSSREDALALMLRVWPYATPRMHGLYKTRWLMEGLNAYMTDNALPGNAEMFSVPPLRPLRPKLGKITEFIRAGLAEDIPLGFLNLHNGGIETMYSWHWMPLAALEETDGNVFATVWDEGKEITFDLAEWLMKTRFGGGLVRIRN